MKTCGNCKKVKDIEEFAFKNKEKTKRQSYCRSCQKVYREKHYIKNRDRLIDLKNKRKEILREWYISYKKDKKCVLCDEDFAPCLQFHHVDSNKKEKAISKGLENGWSIEHLKKEIEKCILVCANCHIKIHSKKTNL